MREQAETGDFSAALVTIASVPKIDERVEALQNVAEQQALAGDVSGALARAEARQKPMEKTFSLLGVAGGILNACFPPPPTITEKDWEWQPE